MKRTVLTAVIMLILAMFFASCGWDIEIRNPEEGGLSTEENSVSTDDTSLSTDDEDSSSESEDEPESEDENVQKEETKGEFSLEKGDSIILETGEDFTMRNAVLEFGDRIIVYSVEGEIAGFDTEIGEKIYSNMFGSWNSVGYVTMKKTDEKEGFDYCVYTRENMIYLSSTDPDKLLSEALPKEVIESNMFGGITGTWYSTDETNILWQNKEGIMVIPKNGGEEKLILDNTDIEKDIVATAKEAFDGGFSGNNGGPYIYIAPEFICGGTKIAVTVTSWDYVFWAVAVYNLETEEFEAVYSFGEQETAQYPLADRYIIIRGSRGVKLIDAKVKRELELDSFAGYAFENGEDIYFALQQWNDGGGAFELFISEDATKDDSDRLMIKVTDPTVSGNICGITESYIAFSIYDKDNKWNCIINFKDSE